MQSHKLGLEVLETSNEKLLRLVDMSVYNQNLGVTCAEILITAPGYQFSSSVDPLRLTQGFNLVLTACDLEIQNNNCDSEFHNIPDGVYAIKYSVSPNEYTDVTLQHLRIVQATKRMRKIYCDIDLGACMVMDDKKKTLLDLRLIGDYFQAAKAKVEVCGKLSQGVTIYKYALKMLDKIDCKSCK